MKRVTEIAPGIHYVGANDRTKHRFEGLWPLPNGVSYNAYLIEDEKIALVDTIDAAFTERLLGSIREVIGDRPVDYLIINHMEPDHSASIDAVRRRWPGITIVGNTKTLQMVEGFYGIGAGTLKVGDGDTLSLGRRTLSFHLIPMVHWPETMVTHCAREGLLFSGDAFGSFGALDGGVTDVRLDAGRDTSPFRDEMVRYYSNIVGKYGGPVQRAIEKLASLGPLRTVCPTHGPVWTREFPRVLDLYDRMSRYEPLEKGVVIAYASMYGNTEQSAERLARELVARGVKRIAMHNLTSSHVSFVLRDIFKYNALVIGSPTYNMGLFPEVRSLVDDLELRCIPSRVFACFGGFTWAGAAVKKLTEFAGRMGWEPVAPPVEVKQGFTPEKSDGLALLADAIVEAVIA
ncbi:MAG: FprA family A-type flavoprotein [Alistipes sp.]|jgi:flavorubredoxin|nr:FprA family A-type flavoprotein [Alistipes sp.]MDR2883061.1 FprA family A-type flavoprotein [Alistipes sp.]